MRFGSLLASGSIGTVVSALVLALVPGAAMAAPQVASAVDKGPIGWQVYRDAGRLATMRPGAVSRQFSSFDRGGGNNDGFEGTYSCLRTTATGCVLAERTGAGQIDSMWFTRDFGSMAANGRIKVELDGAVVLDQLLQEVVDGKLGAPYVWPLVGNGEDTSGGAVIKVPMPYRESMRVTLQANPRFYHVNFRDFADADGVQTFDPADRALDVVAKLRAYGVQDPKGVASDRLPVVRDSIASGSSREVATMAGSGWITQLRIQAPGIVRSPRVGDDGRAFAVGGSSTFKVAIDPGNQGVRITRRYDPQVGNQRARLSVDGTEVGYWESGARIPTGQWRDQAIVVPAALTAGKSTLTLLNEYLSSDLDVNEFRFDIHSDIGGVWRRTDVMDVGPNHPGDEQAHGYVIRGLSWQGYRVFRYPVPDADVARSDALLAGVRVVISFDGKVGVDAPLGEFFGSGLGEYDTLTLMSSIDTAPDGWYTAWWPMPYGRNATVTLVNESGATLGDVSVETDNAADAAVGPALQSGRLGYFRATHQAGNTVPGRDFTFLETTGRGVYYGVTHSMRGDIPNGNMRLYLEGDERVYVDGKATPTIYGTGTEDFYESGWYFRDGVTYTMPLAGNPAWELNADGCAHDCTGAYRLMLGDAVSFSADLRFDIQHGPVNDAPANYSSTSYWYSQSQPAIAETDMVDVTDDASRAAHGYQSTGETRRTLQSTFEGKDDKVVVTDGVAVTTGAITFNAKLGAGSTGARLVRMADQNDAYQQASVFVDDVQAGTWLQPLGNTSSRWLEDSFELPESLVAGKTSIQVRIVPAGAGSPPWTAARYRLLTKTA
jgi:D-arabinan exo alpha-(1,3)/(1,5)-arabinofuranosidase (non-reducing end)